MEMMNSMDLQRVYYDKFVAEGKYRTDLEGYQKLVDTNDHKGVMKLITNTAVEKQVLRHARLEAAMHGKEPIMSSLPKLEDDKDSNSIIAAAAALVVVAEVEDMKGYSDAA
eukprot:5598320-Ditylum_brightwellii.AAC.1